MKNDESQDQEHPSKKEAKRPQESDSAEGRKEQEDRSGVQGAGTG